MSDDKRELVNVSNIKISYDANTELKYMADKNRVKKNVQAQKILEEFFSKKSSKDKKAIE